MSWKATYWVKTLTHHADGTPLTARQKLVLFVLADYHHDEKGFAWVSTRRAAEESLTSHKWFLAIVASLEKHGTIRVERREGKSNLYYFPLMKPLHHTDEVTSPRPSRHVHHTDEVRVHQTGEVASSPKPLYPTGTDIQPPSDEWRPYDYVLLAIEEGRKTKRSTDEVLGYWKQNPSERPLL